MLKLSTPYTYMRTTLYCCVSVGYLHPQDSEGQLATAVTSALGSLGQDNRESGQGGRVHVVEDLPEVVGVLFILVLALRLGSGSALGTAPRCDRLVDCTVKYRVNTHHWRRRPGSIALPSGSNHSWRSWRQCRGRQRSRSGLPWSPCTWRTGLPPPVLRHTGA